MFEYSPRYVACDGVINVNSCSFKHYQLSVRERPHEPALAGEDLRAALSSLLDDDEERDHKVGFVISHYARDGTYLLISRWTGGNMLKHRAYTATRDAGAWRFEDLAPTGIIACVWEMEVMAFERNAWVRAVMARHGDEHAFADYLAARFSGWV